MKTYAALAALSISKVMAFQQAAYPYVLVSFIFDKRQTTFEKLDYEGIVPMLDSGAHSAWTRGTEIKVDDYIEWAKSYAEKQPSARITNLDVIPGQKGSTPTAREVRRAVDESFRNAEEIRSAGLRVIEVHHILDPIENFDKMIERRREGEVLGLGGLNAVKYNRAEVVDAFGEACFARLRDMCGWDKLPPVHGYGVAVSEIGYRYPLSSIDASSWVAPQMYGQTLNHGRLRRFKKNSVHLKKSYDLQAAEICRIFAMWRKREQDLRSFWRERGVNILEEGPACV